MSKINYKISDSFIKINNKLKLQKYGLNKQNVFFSEGVLPQYEKPYENKTSLADVFGVTEGQALLSRLRLGPPLSGVSQPS